MKKIVLSLFALFCLGVQAQTTYMPAVYPAQQTTCGTATMTHSGDSYTLSNDVFSATYIHRDGKLEFDGCPELGLQSGTELFTLRLGSTGSIIKNASDLILDSLWTEELVGNSTAVKGSEHYNGVALCGRFLHGTSGIVLWRAVLRDGSHYLRTEMEITPAEGKNLRFYTITPMQYNVLKSVGGIPKTVGNTRGAVLISDNIFAGLETPMAYNSSSADGQEDGYETSGTVTDSWLSTDWQTAKESVIPTRVNEVGYYYPNVVVKTKNIDITEACQLNVEFLYKSGTHRMNLCGVDLIDASGNVVASDYHYGYTGSAKENNTFQMEVPYAGSFTLRYWGETKTETITSSGNINIVMKRKIETGNDDASQTVHIEGLWKRQTNLKDGETWKVSAVVGLVSPGQQRRSFLAYSERERAVPWRPYPCYISWYELNIDRNNAPAPDYKGNMTISQCEDVMNHWKTDFYDKYGIAPKAFVWDDGWDQYGTWTFNCNFPNGFREVDDKAREMGSGIGAWLGPVGGYGTSGSYRRAYWSNKGGMVLSNKDYYDVFLAAAKNLTRDQGYDFRFFKFDGISDDFSATGPDKDLEESVANENAEGIIQLESYVRENLREDIFFNTTVGTWASPFWYHYTDATWRQENDYGTIGNNSIDRENWITYRDRLVYQNYVQNSPICPINTLMTHGFILSSHGAVSTNMTYAAVLRELRCAFACGSGMVELYNDYALMNSINNGQLWADLAECMEWQQKNADVLPDIHWVGGNPWNGSKASVYGWASWNGTKCTLALRNGSTSQQTFTTTLREALDIPASVTGKITLQKSFKVQDSLSGLTIGTPIDIDAKLTMKLPASTVFVFDGLDSTVAEGITSTKAKENTSDIRWYTLSGNKAKGTDKGILISTNGQKISR